MKIHTLKHGETTGCVTFPVGTLTVSVSNVFATGGGQIAVWRDCLRDGKPLKEWSTHSPENVVKAIRWAQRRSKS